MVSYYEAKVYDMKPISFISERSTEKRVPGSRFKGSKVQGFQG
jgi:hypothetical protein